MNLFQLVKKWRIALLCSVVNLLHLGQRKIVGLLFVACLERYSASREHVSFAFMLHVTVYNLCGPLVGVLGSKCGIKSITIYGCLLSSVSIAACFFAEDITFILICYGIPSGIGEAMATHLLPSLIYYHFKTKQAVANGIAFAGPCLGGFFFSPLCKTLLDAYGTSETFLIMGALTLNSIPAAMLLVNPTTNNKTHEEDEKNTTSEFKKKNKENHYASISDSDDHSTYNDTAKHDNQKLSNTNNSRETLVDCKSQNKSLYIRKTAKEIENKDHILEGDVVNNVDKDNGTKSQVVRESKNYGSINLSAHIPENFDSQIYNQRNIKTHITETNESSSNVANDINNTIGKCDISQKIIKNQLSVSEIKEESTFRYKRLDTINQNTVKKVTTFPPTTKSDSKKSSIWKLFSVLYDPLFILISIVTSSHMFIMMTLNTIMVDFAIDKGFNVNHGVYLLMCATVADMVGRFSLGWVTDNGHVSVTSFAAFFYFGIALCYAAFAVTTDFFVVMLTIGVGGLFMGALMTVFPVMLSEYCAAEKNTMALASRYIFMVPISLATAPLIGFFRESLGSYVWMLCFVDFICILCCIVLFLIPPISRYRNRNVTQK